MAIKVPQEYADYDFGFTGVDESEIKQDVLDALNEKDQALTEKEQEEERLKIKAEETKIRVQKEKEQVILAWKEGWKQGANFSADPELYFTANYLSDEEKS